MSEPRIASVAIVDYGMGNLFSVKHACEHVGLRAAITASRQDIVAADAVVLPGVGAFGDAMVSLEQLDLIAPLRDIAASGTPLLGICLGLQLLMTESEEFGSHRGLAIIAGRVVRIDQPRGASHVLKVPHVGWNRVLRPTGRPDAWKGSLLEGLDEGTPFHFAHSYYVEPADPRAVIGLTVYGTMTFASCVRAASVFGCQAHPERSGPAGLHIYRTLADRLRDRALLSQGA
jgi:glutamine amidotransferase